MSEEQRDREPQRSGFGRNFNRKSRHAADFGKGRIVLPSGANGPPVSSNYAGDIGHLEVFGQQLRADPYHSARTKWHLPFLAGTRVWDLGEHRFLRVGRDGVVCRLEMEYTDRCDGVFIEFIANFYRSGFVNGHFSLSNRDLLWWHVHSHVRQHLNQNRQKRARSRADWPVWFNCYGDERDGH